MSIRAKILGLVDVMLRIPPIIVMDEILKVSMGTSIYFSSQDTAAEPTATETLQAAAATVGMDMPTDTNSTATLVATMTGVLSETYSGVMGVLSQEADISGILGLAYVRFFLCIFCFCVAACVFMLWTRHLIMVYMFLISLFITHLSYWSNVAAVDMLQQNEGHLLENFMSFNRLLDTGILSLAPHLVVQWMLGSIFSYMQLGPRYNLLQKPMPFIFISPIIIAMLPLPSIIVRHAPFVAKLVLVVLIKITAMYSAMEVGKTLYNGYVYGRNFVASFGLSALVENEWQRLHVPNVLRVFWLIRITHQFVFLAREQGLTNMEVMPTVQTLLVDGCETLTAVLGMTAVISLVCHYIGHAFQWYLITYDHDEEKSLGTVSAVLFYVLALQTGLVSLEPDKRFVRLCRNFCLLVTAMLHFLHNIVSPILMSLSAARNPSLKRHVRALSVCAFLIIAPTILLVALWSRFSPSTWLLAVTAFSAEIIVKVLVSLTTYALFIIDARRQSFWERLDDYLYYVRSFGNSVEFCFGIFLFFNGAWILFFESSGAIRALMMCIHAYFNIWCEARAGWSVFMKRRSAVTKISSLPEATTAQLRAFDDVCAICYQDMYSAKITRCRHFFHGVCLRKWLYVQDRCPLCHEIMIYTDSPDENAEARAPVSPEYAARMDGGNLPGSNRASAQRTASSDELMPSSSSLQPDQPSNASTSAAATTAAIVDGTPDNSFRITATTTTTPVTNVGSQR